MTIQRQRLGGSYAEQSTACVVRHHVQNTHTHTHHCTRRRITCKLGTASSAALPIPTSTIVARETLCTLIDLSQPPTLTVEKLLLRTLMKHRNNFPRLTSSLPSRSTILTNHLKSHRCKQHIMRETPGRSTPKSHRQTQPSSHGHSVLNQGDQGGYLIPPSLILIPDIPDIPEPSGAWLRLAP
jgi:hypothetical protein